MLRFLCGVVYCKLTSTVSSHKYEMNGAWMDYGLDPETYVEVWKQLSEAIKAHEDATDTWLVWAPNVAYVPST